MASYFLGEDVSDFYLITQMTIQRDILLATSDWSVLPDTPTDKTAWTDYRQQLRDFPATWIPASVVDFPDPPEQ
jgi:hypothetical protein